MKFYIELGRNGYSFDQVKGVTLRELLDDIGFDYDMEGNEELLDSVIFAKDGGNTYGAAYYGINGVNEVEEDKDDDE